MTQIREAKVAEIKEIQTLIKQGVKEGLLLAREKSELKKLLKQKNVVIAQEENPDGTNGEIVGIVILDFYSRRLSELRSLYIKPEHRSKGLGTLLVEAIFEKAKKKKIHELLTITMKEKTPWFQKQGFSEETHHFKVALFKKM